MAFNCLCQWPGDCRNLLWDRSKFHIYTVSKSGISHAGKQNERVEVGEILSGRQLYYTYSLGYLVTQVVIKQSTTLMLLRFAVEDYHRKIIYGLTIMIYVVSAIILALCVFQCIPLSFFWTRAAGDLDGRCLSPSVAVKGAAIYSGVVILFDLSMAVLPWIMVRKLQLDLRTRLMVTAVLALGSM